MRHGRKNQHANVLSSFRKICISWGSRPTVEWNETDYDVVGEGAPVGRTSTMSGANFSLD
jgi:hypothetical protein